MQSVTSHALPSYCHCIHGHVIARYIYPYCHLFTIILVKIFIANANTINTNTLQVAFLSSSWKSFNISRHDVEIELKNSCFETHQLQMLQTSKNQYSFMKHECHILWHENNSYNVMIFRSIICLHGDYHSRASACGS